MRLIFFGYFGFFRGDAQNNFTSLSRKIFSFLKSYMGLKKRSLKIPDLNLNILYQSFPILSEYAVYGLETL